MKKEVLSGIISLLFLLCSLVIAAVNLLINDYFFYLIMYIVFIMVGFWGILFFYCRKCKHIKSHTCRHWLPGFLINKWFKKSAQSCSSFDIIIVLTALLFILGFHPIWLYKNILLLFLFWINIISACVIISAFVCKGCYNTNCTFYNNKNFKS